MQAFIREEIKLGELCAVEQVSVDRGPREEVNEFQMKPSEVFPDRRERKDPCLCVYRGNRRRGQVHSHILKSTEDFCKNQRQMGT